MNRFSILFSLLIFISITGFGQASNGRVNSLVAAENYFSAFAKKEGSRQAFLKVSDEETLIFRPDPVKVKDFYNKGTIDGPGQLSWEPVYAKISRSGDWGFTTGPYTYSAHPEAVPAYGQYLSVWQTNKKGVWKLALDLGISHGKPGNNPELNFTDPYTSKFYRPLSESRLKQREDMIITTDKLYSNTLIKDQSLAYDVFLTDYSRLLFPGYEPIIGKARINNFISKNQISIESVPQIANRALGSDLAYTYGIAYITKDKVITKYNYVRIWESQEGHQWNAIIEIFTPAGN